VDNISNQNKTMTGFSLYYLSSGLLVVSLFLTNWIGGVIFSAAWLINYYLWIQLKEELETLPNANGSASVTILLKRFNLGNLLLTIWAAVLVLFQIFLPPLAWIIYPFATLGFLPSFWTTKTIKKIKDIMDEAPLAFNSLGALENLAAAQAIVLDEMTTGEIIVEDILLAEGIKEELFSKMMGTFLQALHTKNNIITGLNSHFKHAKTYPVKNIVTFSKSRNWSSMYLESIGTVFLGPAESLLKETPDFVIQTLTEGKRVMALSVSPDEHHGKELPDTLFTVALLVLTDTLKTGLPQLMEALAKEEIQFKVLTREDPIRMANLAKYVGLPISLEQNIFGELEPAQKNEICESLSETSQIAYIGNLSTNVSCRIGSLPESHPDILAGQDLAELADTLGEPLEEIRKLLAS